MSKDLNPFYKRALRLEYITIAWNILEGLVSMILGVLAGSVSLFAYGLESSVEVFASAVTVWELKGVEKGREKKALRMIGYAYLFVAAFIFFDVIKSIIQANRAEESLFGIVFMILTIIIMLVLGMLKLSVGKKLKNNVVIADAKFTLVDAGLSATVLIGLVLNFLFGWWWTDQILAIFLAGTALREGLNEIKT